jgi:rhamnose utilization protein RhaD (predicted bifunctional aldolase and dehydrogenase)
MGLSALDQVVELSHRLGNPGMDCAILGEGNTSTRHDQHSFWVKGSGAQLRSISADEFVQVSFDRVLSLLEGHLLTDEETKQALSEAKLDPAAPGHPSVETLLHGILLSLDGVNFVGHTHPTAINILACSNAFPDAFTGRLFPDEIVMCGVMPLLIPYVDPGIPLARKVKQLLQEYIDQYGERPRIVIMQNHGLIALGDTAQKVEDITQMAVKAARILHGALAIGGAHFLSDKDVNRIHTRLDEQYRRQKISSK